VILIFLVLAFYRLFKDLTNSSPSGS